MKLIVDENHSPELVDVLSDLIPDSVSANAFSPKPVSDRRIWDLAREGGYSILSKDGDSQPMALLHGPPPNFIWVRCGNRSVAARERYIRTYAARIVEFLEDEKSSVLVL